MYFHKLFDFSAESLIATEKNIEFRNFKLSVLTCFQIEVEVEFLGY